MSALLDIALRSSVLLLAGLVVRAALKRKSAALRHFVLAGSVAAAAAVGPLGLVLPSWLVSLPRLGEPAPAVVYVPVARHGGVMTAAGTVPAGTPQSANLVSVAGLVRVWLAGCLAFAAVLAAGMLRLAKTAWHAAAVHDARWRRTADAVARGYGLERNIVIRRTRAPVLVATYGIVRPRVLVPSHAADWSDDRIYVVLCHELAHVRRLDWPVQIAAEIVRTLFWFNPLIWIACAYLRRDSEQACDDLVLQRGVAARDYAAHLLELARKCRRSPSLPLPATPIARRSTLERRISDMLNIQLDRRPVPIGTLVMACALLAVVLLTTATLRAAQTGPATLLGTVYDTTGAVIPGVALTLNDVTQMKYTTTTDATGRFAFVNVQRGHYTLEASLPGFRALRQEFDLSVPRDWDRAITLQLGTLRESITVSARRTATPPSGPARPQPIRVGGSLRAPLKTLDVRPVYPASMRDAGREGVVPIEAIIGVEGTVTSVRVLSADVHPDFAVAAVDAVRQWRFTPTLLNGSPVEVVMTVSVAFTLSDQ